MWQNEIGLWYDCVKEEFVMLGLVGFYMIFFIDNLVDSMFESFEKAIFFF